MKGLTLGPRGTDAMMPMHLWAAAGGRVLRAGPALQKLCHDRPLAGERFADLFRRHCPDPGHYSFWDYRASNAFKQNLGWRIDHLMATETLAKKCTACYIDGQPRAADRPSDHTPVVAEFDW